MIRKFKAWTAVICVYYTYVNYLCIKFISILRRALQYFTYTTVDNIMDGADLVKSGKSGKYTANCRLLADPHTYSFRGSQHGLDLNPHPSIAYVCMEMISTFQFD